MKTVLSERCEKEFDARRDNNLQIETLTFIFCWMLSIDSLSIISIYHLTIDNLSITSIYHLSIDSRPIIRSEDAEKGRNMKLHFSAN